MKQDESRRAPPAADVEATFLLGEIIEDCSEHAARCVGRTRAEILGRSLLELSPAVQPDGRRSEQVLRQRIEAARAGLAQSFEWRFARDAEAPLDTLMTLEPLPDGRMLQGRVRDVTQLRRAEAALQESETRLQQILDNTTAFVYVKDQRGRFLFANRHFVRLFRMREADIIGRTDGEIFPAELAAEYRRNDERVLASTGAIEFEEKARLEDGEHTYISLKFPLFNTRGEPYAVCGISTDITERKRTEEALRHAALGVSGARGSDVFPALVRYVALALGVDFAFISLPRAEQPARMRTIALYAKGQIVDNIEYELAGGPCETVLGQQFRFYARDAHRLFPGDPMLRDERIEGYAGVPLFDSLGQPIGLMAALHGRPLTDARLAESMLRIFSVRAAAEVERSRADEARQISEASYRAIFEASEDAIFVYDWDSGAIVDVNPKACAEYGYTYEEMKAVDVGMLSAGEHPYTLAEAVRLIEKAKQGEPQRFEWHRRSRDRSLHWDEVCLRAAVIAGERRVLAFTREITDRKRAEDALRASEEQYRSIFNASVDGLAVCTLDGRIVDANPAFCRMHGYSRDELLAAESFQFIAPDSQLRCWAFFEAVSEGHALSTEAKTLRKDGTAFAVEFHGVPVHYHGQPHLLAIVRDITERKVREDERGRLETQLRQAQKMESIGHLTGGVAHDFNNILTTIIGYIDMSRERLAQHPDEKLEKYLERALRSGRQARDLIQQMLTFSRGQRGEPRAVSLSPLMNESVKLLRSMLPSSIEFETDFDADLPPVFHDPIQLEQVLMNLCINARDAMHGAGMVRVALRQSVQRESVCASCRQSLSGTFVELAVGDSGPGIRPEIVDRMFEPFFTTKDVGKGSGMGLSTVHGIVHEHGGHIVVDTAPGAGATFRVLLKPIAASAGPQETAAAEGAERAGAAHRLEGQVLVVDDEPAVAEFMQELFASWGLEVTVRHGGGEAAALFVQNPRRFDLVVTDQTMPRMTGVELARALLEQRPDLPVILYTGYTERLTEEQTRTSGIRAFVTKPIDTRALFDLVRDLLQR